MYIFFNLGNNYSRGENMKMKRVKPLLVPMIYGVCVIAFLFCMYFAGRLSNDLLFKDKKILIMLMVRSYQNMIRIYQ